MALLRNSMPFPRLFILTDMTSTQSGVREPDDAQSMIRLFLYADRVQLVGLAATSNLQHGQVTRPELIRQIIDAYEQDWPKLSRDGRAFPAAETLRAVVSGGQPFAGKDMAPDEHVGRGQETETSAHLVREIQREVDEPLWVCVWGGTTDLAQTLWTMRAKSSRAAFERDVARLRVHSIGDQDSTGAWIKSEFPEVFYITRQFGYRGMYRGGDTTLCDAEWVEKHVHGHGALGNLYPSYEGGDIWSATLGRVRGVKEGDTPSYLNLLGNDPLNGWGGEIVEVAPNRYEDAVSEPGPASDPDPRMYSVYRHRPALQADFAARLKWCV